MLSHIVSDLHEAYVEEILKPQLGSNNAPKPSGEGSSKPSDPGEAAAKRVRQAVYDIRYRARREDIPLDQAFNQYMSHTSMNAVEKKEVREKLGMGVGGGGATPVKEDTQDIEEYAKPGEYYLRVDPRKRGTGEKPYVRKYDPSNPKDVAKRHKLEARGIKTTATKYGTPYEGGNPNAGEPYEKNYKQGGKNTVGDLDNDGTKEPNSHEYAGVKDNAIKRARAKRTQTPKKKPVKEGFSNWRANLLEITNATDEIESSNEKQIKEKKVDNYSGGKNKAIVQINPQFNESIENLGGHLIESFELSEDYLIETSNIAADYFYQNGLNEEGLEIVIEDIGLDNFVEFVFDISEEFFLNEEQTRLQKKAGKSLKSPKGARAQSSTNAQIKSHGLTRRIDVDSPKGTVRKKILKDKANKSIEKAKESQPSKKPVRDAIARGIFGAVKAYQAGMERHRKAMGLARETGKTVAKAAKVTHEAGRRAGESPIGKKVKKVGGAVVRAGVKKVQKDIETTKQALKKEEFELQEKAESEQQQKLFGLALSVKRGKTPRSEVSAEVLKIVDTMSEKEIRKFAGTSHEGIPKKKEVTEAIARVGKTPTKTETKQRKTQLIQLGMGEDFDVSTMTPQELNLRKQKASIEDRLADLRKRTIRTQKPQQKPQQQSSQMQNASYEPEGELVDERTRYAKKTGKSFKTGRASVEGGDPEVAARNVPPLKYGGSKQAPKKRGQKPPVAGEPGSGRQDPAHMVAVRRASAERAKQQRIGSKYD